ncbi:MAG TPA: SURF1 family protein [Rhizomicrobium sp.]|jgi:surfeit locus 1 family protein|nr:SURF1 family protein [Rhizomicrobium sp.]
MMFFRPLPALTVACALLFAFLIGLGVWQLQRLQWKLGLIAQVNAHMSAPPIALDRALALGADAQYRRVALHGRFDNAREAYVFGTGVEGAPVFHVIVPFRTDDGRLLLVDRGIVPRDLRNPATRPDGIRSGETGLVGVWHDPEPPGPFTPPPDLQKRVWYSRNVAGMARADGEVLAADTLVEADATPNPGGWPRGGQTVVAFRNEHLQYAITWFLMAAGLLGVYLAYHASRGRLGLKSRD